MDELRDLYQEVIFDHNRRPRNFGKPALFNRHADGHNPLCGDRLSLYLQLEGERIADAKFEGSGCAISTASASLLTEGVKGKTLAEAQALFEGFHRMVTGTQGDTAPALGKLQVFVGVREFPARVKCATLAWHTLHAALSSQEQHAVVTTE